MPPSNAHSVSLEIINDSGKTLVYGARQGLDPADLGGKWLCMNKSGSTWLEAPQITADNVARYLPKIEAGSTVSVEVPSYETGGTPVGFRFYFAFTEYRDETLKAGRLSAPDLFTSDFVFDKFEGGLASVDGSGSASAIWNVTAVDFVGLPMQLTKGGVTVGFKDGVTAKGLWGELIKLGAPYDTAPNHTSVEGMMRFFAPGHLRDTGSFLDTRITDGIEELAKSRVVVYYGNYTYRNFSAVGKDGLACEYTDTSSTTPTPVSLFGITTKSALAGTIEQTGSKPQKNFGAIVSAGICRGVLGRPERWGCIAEGLPNCPKPWFYYPSGVESDEYSKRIHAYSIDGKNYGFPYDDYFNEEAGFPVETGDSVQVKLLPFDGPLEAQPNPKPPVTSGSLNITVPDRAVYPSGSGWDIGAIEVGDHELPSGNSILCCLPSDAVVCTFPSFPKVTMTIPMTDDGDVEFSGEVGGAEVTGITGLVYTAGKRLVQFGQSAQWTTK